MTEHGVPRARQWFLPGEIVLVGRVPRGALSEAQVHDRLRAHLQPHAAHFDLSDGGARSFAFDAPGEPTSLVFVFQRLADAESPRAVKDAIQTVHRTLGQMRGELEVVSAMPHWRVKAHELFGGGSPGSEPVPVPRAPGPRYAYRPVNPKLDLHGGGAVPVAVLDTHTTFQSARQRAERFRTEAGNLHLQETLDLLGEPGDADPRYDAEWNAIRGDDTSELAEAYAMPDHGLFICGLIHGIARGARVTLEPVLDDHGVGDLSVVLVGLKRVLERKQREAPVVVNLSLGFVPHPERLVDAWYGRERPNDAEFVHVPELREPASREEMDSTAELLQVGLRELARYLRLNNCLVVAAAGNDSLGAANRMPPRLPALFETVLGVSATTADAHQAAPYSNVADLSERGDHVATFGGSVNRTDQPEDGVIGIYAGDFPSGAENATGWAYWSGTSFATAIVSGIAANLWAQRADLDAAGILRELYALAAEHGPFVPELRAPAIEVHGGSGE